MLMEFEARYPSGQESCNQHQRRGDRKGVNGQGLGIVLKCRIEQIHLRQDKNQGDDGQLDQQKNETPASLDGGIHKTEAYPHPHEASS